jgi:hypothetical protein
MAAAGEISLNEDVLVQVRQIKEQEQEKLHQQQLRKNISMILCRSKYQL